MIQEKDALAAVEAQITALDRLPEGDAWVVYPELTREYAFGWVFFYGSRLFSQTREFRYAVAGNAPLIVDRRTGTIVATGTAEPIDAYIARYQMSATDAGT